MKIMIGVLLIGLLLSVSVGVYQPSFTTLSRFDSNTLVNVIYDAINYCGKAVEIAIAFYQDFMASNKIVYLFKYYLPPDQNHGTIVLLGCGFLGLWGYSMKRMKK